MPTQQIPLPDYRKFVAAELAKVRERAPVHIRILMSHTAPPHPGYDADEATQRQWLAQVAEHAAAFDDFVRALERIRNSVERNVSGRVH